MNPVAAGTDLSSVLEALTDGVLKVDARGVLVYINAAASRAIGLERAALIDKSYSELNLPFAPDPDEEGKVYEWHGRSYRVRVSCVEDGSRVLQMRDVSSEVETEADLHRNREFLHAVLDNIEAGVVACDETGTLRVFNDATRAFHGRHEKAIPPEDWARHYNLYSADGLTPLRKEEVPLYRALSGEAIRNVQIVIAPADGPRRTVLASGRALIGRDGRKLGAVVAMHDISHRKHSGARIREALKQFRTLFNDGPIAYHESTGTASSGA
jgi:PAS domain-containing protein